VFEHEYPDYRIVQLAVDGSSPLPTLRDLANDDEFTGLVVVSANSMTVDDLARSVGQEKQQTYVSHYRTSWTGVGAQDKVVDRNISAFAQEHFVVFSVPFAEICSRGSLGEPLFGVPKYLVTHSDRSRSADYKALDIVSHRAERIWRGKKVYRDIVPLGSDEWLVHAKEMDEIADRIRNRGGRVVYVIYITTGEYYEMEQEFYPKPLYWDRFAEVAGDVVIHFHDVPSLRDYNCPDTSHLDYRDASRYTRALAEELERRGVIHR